MSETIDNGATVVAETPIEKPKNTKFCADCGAQINAKAEICPKCGVRQAPATLARPPKDRITAALLALFLGGLGIHKFYLAGGSTKWGIIYLVFCWTFIPAILALIEALLLFVMSDNKFHMMYG
jgi:TM2 domain-containing membrane protein YozV/ribosomal protein L40E